MTGSCIYIYIFFSTALNCGVEAIFFFFVCDEELMVQQDDDVLPSGFLLANAAGTESGGRPVVVE